MPSASKRRTASQTRPDAKTINVPSTAAAKPKVVKPKTAARKAKQAAVPKRKRQPAQRRRKSASKPHPISAAAPAVIALPYLPEPLVAPELAPLPQPAIDLAAWSALARPQSQSEPLPRARSVAVYRSGGLFGALADWLGSSTQQLWRRLGELGRPAPKRTIRLGLVLRRLAQPEDELQRLRAENEQLRRQLEALTVLQSATSGNREATPA